MPKPCFVTAIAVMSLDGRIAEGTDDAVTWSSAEDKKQLHDFLQHETDVCVMGRKSYDLCHYISSAKYPLLILSRQYQEPTKLENNNWGINPQTTDLLTYCYQNYGPRVSWLGGQQIYNYGFQNGLIDVLRLTIEPIILGKGLALCYNVALPSMTIDRTQLLNNHGTILVNYKVHH